MIANIASAKLPTIATRLASCGVIGPMRSSGGWITLTSSKMGRTAQMGGAAG